MQKLQLKGAIEEVLSTMGMHSESATTLLMGTAAVESQLGYYIKQIGGPARGIFQMEPNTEEDIWHNYLKYQPSLRERLLDLGYRGPDPAKLVYDLQYQIIMARIHYYRVSDPLPSSIEGQAQYWKEHYNTKLGAGTVEKYLKAFQNYVR